MAMSKKYRLVAANGQTVWSAGNGIDRFWLSLDDVPEIPGSKYPLGHPVQVLAASSSAASRERLRARAARFVGSCDWVEDGVGEYFPFG